MSRTIHFQFPYNTGKREIMLQVEATYFEAEQGTRGEHGEPLEPDYESEIQILSIKMPDGSDFERRDFKKGQFAELEEMAFEIAEQEEYSEI